MMGVGVSKIGSSSEKQAAEMTIARLKGEIGSLTNRLEWTPKKIEKTKIRTLVITILIGLGVMIPLALIAKDHGLLWIFLIILMIVWIVILVTAGIKYQPNPEYVRLKQELELKQADLEKSYEIVRRP